MGTTSQSVFPSGSEVYVKSGSTETKIASSTGALYHQGTILPNSTLIGPLSAVTWPSTVAQTLVNTSNTQTLEAKTLGSKTGWSVTTPTSASTNALICLGHGLNIIDRTTGKGSQAYVLSLVGTQKGAPCWIMSQGCNSSDTITVATTAVNLINYTTAAGGLENIAMTCPGSLVKLICWSTTLGWVLESIGSTLCGVSGDGTTTLPTLTS